MTQDADLLIIGGGLAGLATALACAHEGLSAIVIDAAPAQARLDAGFDGRASAIAYANFRMFDRLGVGPAMREEAQPIHSILVTDGRAPDGLRGGGPGPTFLHFNRRELDDREEGEPLGFMVENRHMRAVLLKAAAAHDAITLIAPAKAAGFQFDPAGARVTLEDGRTLAAELIIAADGAGSAAREAAKIGVTGWGYGQDGIVATVAHERPHEGVAHECFLPGGPFAILPLTENRASLVWTEPTKAAGAAIALEPELFTAEVRRRFGDFLGAIEVLEPRWRYPLGLQIADRFVAERCALVGDAARRIHPIAGQGFNLGLKDGAALSETLGDAVRVGLSIGGADVLERYESWRRFDSVTLAVATDVFTRLYSNDVAPVRLMRDLGMAAVNQVPLARRLFTRHAGADLGELPRLLRPVG